MASQTLARADLSLLWESVRIGSVTLPNRIVLSAHNTVHDDAQLAAYLAARAAGGAGLVVMGGVPVHPTSVTNPKLIPAWEESSVARLRAVADTVREAASAAPAARVQGRTGALFCQIFHAGPNDPGNSVFAYPHVAIAPSAVAVPPAGRIPKVADQDDIDEIVAGFATTAHHLQLAGFDGVEISGNHGYLVHAFLSPTSNHRHDQYGGSARNRARFALELGRAIKDRCGVDFPVVMRLSLDERIGEAGMTPHTSRDLLEILHRSGLFDAFSISGGIHATLDETVAPASAQRDAVFLDSARVAREVLGSSVPLMLTGSIMELSRAAQIVADGDADLIGMARAQIADPDLVLKGLTGRSDEIRHCIKGNQGCWRGVKTRSGMTCTVNPVVGRESTWGEAQPTSHPRRVLVVGGGPAGLKVAEVAAERGHEVTLVERADRLGGQLWYAGSLPGRSSWLRAAEDLAASLARLGVEVRTGVEADLKLVRALRPDAVVLATGATWETDGWSHVAPTSPGPRIARDATVLGPLEAIERAAELGRRVVIIDDTGGYAPLGVAELLLDGGATVEILSPRSVIGDQTALTGEASFVIPRILAKGVRLTPGSTVESIDAAGLWVRAAGSAEPRRIAADAVVTCLHRSPRHDLVDDLRSGARAGGPQVYRIGDALAPREADDAMLEGVVTGRLL